MSKPTETAHTVKIKRFIWNVEWTVTQGGGVYHHKECQLVSTGKFVNLRWLSESKPGIGRRPTELVKARIN